MHVGSDKYLREHYLAFVFLTRLDTSKILQCQGLSAQNMFLSLLKGFLHVELLSSFMSTVNDPGVAKKYETKSHGIERGTDGLLKDR